MIVSRTIEPMAFAVHYLKRIFTQTSYLIYIQPALSYTRMCCHAQLVCAQFALWRVKCMSGGIFADNAFDVFECRTSVYPNIKFLLQILPPLLQLKGNFNVTPSENVAAFLNE